VPARPVQVVDTVGAGDAFTVGLLDALWAWGCWAQTAGPTSPHRTGRPDGRLQSASLSSALTIAVPVPTCPTAPP